MCRIGVGAVELTGSRTSLPPDMPLRSPDSGIDSVMKESAPGQLRASAVWPLARVRGRLSSPLWHCSSLSRRGGGFHMVASESSAASSPRDVLVAHDLRVERIETCAAGIDVLVEGRSHPGLPRPERSGQDDVDTDPHDHVETRVRALRRRWHNLRSPGDDPPQNRRTPGKSRLSEADDVASKMVLRSAQRPGNRRRQDPGGKVARGRRHAAPRQIVDRDLQPRNATTDRNRSRPCQRPRRRLSR